MYWVAGCLTPNCPSSNHTLFCLSFPQVSHLILLHPTSSSFLEPHPLLLPSHDRLAWLLIKSTRLDPSGFLANFRATSTLLAHAHHFDLGVGGRDVALRKKDKVGRFSSCPSLYGFWSIDYTIWDEVCLLHLLCPPQKQQRESYLK